MMRRPTSIVCLCIIALCPQFHASLLHAADAPATAPASSAPPSSPIQIVQEVLGEKGGATDPLPAIKAALIATKAGELSQSLPER